MKKSIFAQVVPEEKLNPHFCKIAKNPAAAPARAMLEEVYETFIDNDGNFLEQFQTTGFDQRYFELYLHAYLSRSSYSINREHENPDFLVTQDGVTVAIEATTANPPQAGALAKYGKSISDLSYDDLKTYQNEELPIRLGSPLYSKLNKRYWEKPQCKDIPFVIAIEAFHDAQSLTYTDAALTQFLYGFRQKAAWAIDGKLILDSDAVGTHEIPEKVIPSNFFSQPGTEHLSAVLFTNAGTHAKFQRMGYQHGYCCENVNIERFGFCLNPHPDAMDPSFFSYNLAYPPVVETWGQGIVVLHNPNALIPLPRYFFADAVECYMDGSRFVAERHSWHPLTSSTLTRYFETKLPFPLVTPDILVEAIPKKQFEAIYGYSLSPRNPFLSEEGWFSDSTNSFLGVLTRDKTDDDWGYAVLARDQFFHFRAIDMAIDIPHRDEARIKLQIAIAGLLKKEQRIYPQD